MTITDNQEVQSMSAGIDIDEPLRGIAYTR